MAMMIMVVTFSIILALYLFYDDKVSVTRRCATILVALGLAFLAKTFLISLFQISSVSMEPSIHGGDVVMVNKLYGSSFCSHQGKLSRGDVIVFRFPSNPSNILVKRIVGLPRDVLLNEGARPAANSKLTALPGPTDHGMKASHNLEVPGGCFFVMGDNRNKSYDSRHWGFVRSEDIIGKVSFIFSPKDWCVRAVRSWPEI